MFQVKDTIKLKEKIKDCINNSNTNKNYLKFYNKTKELLVSCIQIKSRKETDDFR